MRFLRSTSFFTASVAAHLVVVALLFRSAAGDTEEAPASGALTGETLSIPEDLVTEGVEAPSVNAAAPVSPSPPTARTASSPADQGGVRRGFAPASNAAKGGAASTAEPGLYGAAGERSASDLAGAFTRAFPQAASADPVWLSVPFGRAGSAELSLEIDGAGNFVGAHIDGSAPPALRRGIERTVALIRGRTFTARAAITPLHVTATVSPDVVHDGLHGDVFAIGGSFEGHLGNAFFALAVGRRVDLVVSSLGAGSTTSPGAQRPRAGSR